MLDAKNTWDNTRARAALRSMFDAAVASADPFRVLAAHLPNKPRGRCVVVGAGKASAAMAAALEAAWPDVALEGVVVTRDGHAAPTRHVRIMEASHPVPDQRSEAAARAIMQAVQGLGPDDLVVALVSGGGSSLLALPAPGLTLDDKRTVGRQLLRSGATITEMNIVRRYLSAIKGGRLAQAASPAQVLTLVISDVPGDDPSVIASGPTVAPSGTAEDAISIVQRYRLDLSPAVHRVLEQAVLDQKEHKPQPDPRNRVVMIATPLMALQAAADKARQLGLAPLILGDALEGESQVAGILLGGVARSVHLHGLPVRPPAVLLSGGETTVTIRAGESAGKGGRNTEFLLSCAHFLGGEKGIWGLAGDSDGIDGTEDAAGAIFAPDTLARAAQADYMAEPYLRNHDSYTFFKAVGDLVMTGPTLTNVNDIRLLLIA